jgi:hypothetical protein
MTKTHLIKDESLGGVLREYVEVDRKAEVGDYVTAENVIRKVTNRDDIEKVVEFESYPYLNGSVIGWADGYYKTLEPTDIIHVDGKRYRLEPVDSQPADQLDIIARLTRKVAQLERENTDIKRDIETWAQEIERLKRRLDDTHVKVEMVIDDIVTLDERTQPEELAKKIAEVITKGLNAIEPRHYG